MKMPTKNGSTPQLISAKTLAEKLDISRRTLQRLQSKGEVPPPIRLGGSVRWNLDEVAEWIENGCFPERLNRENSQAQSEENR